MEYFCKLSVVQEQVIRWILVAFLALVCNESLGRPAGSFPQRYSDKNLVSAGQHETLEKEKELRKALQQLREAIKEYKQVCAQGLVGPVDRRKDDQCYPPTLDTLVTGIKHPERNYYIVFLRRIPTDPITGKQDWGLRSIQDEKDAVNWGGQNVSDIYSKAEGYATDWTRYRDW